MKELEQLLQEAQGLLVCIALIAGGLQCFFGYKLFRVVTAIVGFIVGGVIGALLGFSMTGEESGAFLGLLVLGILGALLAYSLYQLGVFVICFGAGAIVGMMLSMMMSDRIEPTLVAICGLILGIVGVILTKPLIILSTGVGGGMSMGFALSTLIGEVPAGVILGIILSAIGVFVQFYLEKENGGGASDAASPGGSPAASGAPTSAKPRQPGSPFTFDAVTALTQDDFTSSQAIRGAIVCGLLAFGFLGLSLLGVVVLLVLTAIGLCVGACANRAGIEYFTFDTEDFQNARVYIGGAIGIVVGLLGATSLHGFGWQVWCVIFYLKIGAIIGYLLEMAKNYKEAREYAASKSQPVETPAEAPSSFYNSDPAQSSSGFYNTEPAAPSSVVYVPPASEPKPSAARGDALVSSSVRLWAEGLPIVVTEVSIFPAAEDPSLVSFSLAFQNIGDQPVIGVYLGVKCRDLLNQELESVEKLTIQDFVLERGKSRTYTYPRALPDSDTRRVELIVRHVVMADNSTWDCDEGKILTPLEDQPPLQLDGQLRWQFFKECNGRTGRHTQIIFKSQPQELEGGWRCACGQLNLRETCLACGISRTDLFECIDQDYLQKRYDLQQEKEAQQRAEEEERKRLEAQRQAEEEARRLEAAAAPKPTPKFCTHCGKPLDAVAKFCPHCGKAR